MCEDYILTEKTCKHSRGDWLDALGPIDFERAIREAPERLKRVREFQKQMEEQQKFTWEDLMQEFTI